MNFEYRCIAPIFYFGSNMFLLIDTKKLHKLSTNQHEYCKFFDSIESMENYIEYKIIDLISQWEKKLPYDDFAKPHEMLSYLKNYNSVNDDRLNHLLGIYHDCNIDVHLIVIDSNKIEKIE